MDNLIREIIFSLQNNVSAEISTVWMFLFCTTVILLLLRFYGVFGLYVYNALAIVVANIQVLCFAQYELFSAPIALGTVLFTTTFFVNDLITEHYGMALAKKSIALGFCAQLLVMLWMLISLGHPLPDLQNSSITIQEANNNYLAMFRLFTPSFRILFASLTAYLLSQWLDILIFDQIRKITAGKFLWLRQNIAMLISGLIDTFVFSILAWMLLSDTPVSWHELIFTYVLSAQIIRFLLNISFTPLMYMSYSHVSAKAEI